MVSCVCSIWLRFLGRVVVIRVFRFVYILDCICRFRVWFVVGFWLRREKLL